MKVEILTIFFGQEHLDMFFKTLVPSLLQSTNIPAMLNDGVEVTHRIYCPNEEADEISIYPKLSEIPVEIFPGTVLPSDHDGLSVPFKESLNRGVLTVMAPCDHVFGHGLWRTIKDMQPGDYMVCGHPRIETERGLAPMEEFLKQRNDTENLSMVKFCMEQVAHPMVEHGKRTREPYWHTYNRGDHWDTHFAEPPPLAWWGAPYMLNAWSGFVLFGPWEVIDHEMVEHCRQAGKLKWIDDSRQFFWAEFTNHRRYNPAFQPPLQSTFRYECMRQLQSAPVQWFYG